MEMHQTVAKCYLPRPHGSIYLPLNMTLQNLSPFPLIPVTLLSFKSTDILMELYLHIAHAFWSCAVTNENSKMKLSAESFSL